MPEIVKVLEDMRMADSLRKKLHFISPILTAAAVDAYGWSGLRRLRHRVNAALNDRPADPTLEEQEHHNRRQLERLGLDEGKVIDGPFKGLAYACYSHGSPFMPKILGVYEPELHAWIREAIASDYDCVVNVGCAEGYYAAGFAVALPNAEVFAFDTSPVTDVMVERLVELNGLQRRLHKGRHCGPRELQSILASHARSLVFADIEGGEDALLDIRRAPALVRADLIVESHDRYNAGVTRRLIDRLWATHRFEVIAGGEDADRPIPEIVRRHVPDPADARKFVVDGRGMPELWLRFRARSPDPTRSSP